MKIVTKKRAEVAIPISNKTDFKSKKLQETNKGIYYILIRHLVRYSQKI